MTRTEPLQFDLDQMLIVNKAVGVSEELISNYYKLSASQMRQLNYDIKTLGQLESREIVETHFAQIVRYMARKRDSLLETDADDYYKICLQDHSILATLEQSPQLHLYPFMLYIVCHELIHVVRFRRFLQHFDVAPEERRKEEIRVHHLTREVLSKGRIAEITPVLEYYIKWQEAFFEMDEFAAKTLTSA